MHDEKQLFNKLECFECLDPVEEWWNYCAMCGFHLAAGAPLNYRSVTKGNEDPII